MIRQLTLKNFRRHEDLTIDFTRGLNTLRGANESGKSTVLEGLLYALYGTKALRNSLAETVTWGRKEADLSVRLMLNLGGIDYIFTRSKSGAECNYFGANPTGGRSSLKVTGHAEVTAFAAQLLGADAKTAAALMLASQSGLRGALDEGPVAVSSLMSRLADFDLIDRILTTAQEKLLLGAEAPIRGKVDAAEAEVEAAINALPDEEEVPALDEKVRLQDGIVAVAESVRAMQLAPVMEQAREAYSTARMTKEARDNVLTRITAETQRANQIGRMIAADHVLVTQRPAPEQVEALRARINDAGRHAERLAAYQSVASLPPYPKVFWEGAKEDFEHELQATRTEESRLLQVAQVALAEANALERTLIKDGKCPTCGHQSMSDEHIAAHNTQIMEQVDAKRGIHAANIRTKADVGTTLAALLQVQRDATPFEKLRHQYASTAWPIAIDTSVFPSRVTWTGEVPMRDGADVAVLRRELRTLEQLDRDAMQAEGRISANQQEFDRINEHIERLHESLANLPDVDLVPLAAAYDAAARAHADQVAIVEGEKATLEELHKQFADAQRRREQAWARLEQVSARLREYEDDLKKLAFNNALVKKLKGLRPAITDHLWNSVLAAVSNFFSTLRGEQSVVSKNGDGFRVNGQSVDSLSGSTLDVLALAIRVALTKTFIPHASFVVLDEPAHGCDTTRTGAVLGFLSSIGFEQTLLASHDELSEAVAANVIALGD